MITRLYAQRYGCLTDVVTPQLGRLHAFIGPNDSGKSTLLRAARVLAQFAGAQFDAQRLPFDPHLPFGGQPVSISLVAETAGGKYRVESGPNGIQDGVSSEITKAAHSVSVGQRPWNQGVRTMPGAIRSELSLARLVRFDPDDLRRSSSLIPDTGVVTFLNDRGLGLPGVYDAIINRGDDSFQMIRDSVVKLFPTVRTLRLKAVTSSEKILEVELKDGTRVPADDMSEGLLYFLGFMALQQLAPAALLLVEEPENGLHPARIKEVVAALRAIANAGKTQVLMATHSPLVINELAPEEVTLVTRSVESGTKLTPIAGTPHFDERSKVYALGELWLSYANGIDEAPLLKGDA